MHLMQCTHPRSKRLFEARAAMKTNISLRDHMRKSKESSLEKERADESDPLHLY